MVCQLLLAIQLFLMLLIKGNDILFYIQNQNSSINYVPIHLDNQGNIIFGDKYFLGSVSSPIKIEFDPLKKALYAISCPGSYCKILEYLLNVDNENDELVVKIIKTNIVYIGENITSIQIDKYGNLYFMDRTYDIIGRFSYDEGKNMLEYNSSEILYTSISTNKLNNPSTFIVDDSQGFIYWTDDNENNSSYVYKAFSKPFIIRIPFEEILINESINSLGIIEDTIIMSTKEGNLYSISNSLLNVRKKLNIIPIYSKLINIYEKLILVYSNSSKNLIVYKNQGSKFLEYLIESPLHDISSWAIWSCNSNHYLISMKILIVSLLLIFVL